MSNELAQQAKDYADAWAKRTGFRQEVMQDVARTILMLAYIETLGTEQALNYAKKMREQLDALLTDAEEAATRGLLQRACGSQIELRKMMADCYFEWQRFGRPRVY